MSQLRQIRLQAGIKACELARRMSISRQCVCIAEKKGLKNAAAAKRYAAALGCDWKDLLD